MNVIVTGGAGFIGSHIVDKLVFEGHNVMVIDDLSSGNVENINPSAKFVKKSVLDDLTQEFREFSPDVVIHHAAQVNLRKSLSDPVYDARVNVLGTINILEFSRRFDVKKIIFSSSVAVYGEPQCLPVDENHPLQPLAPYGVSKLCAEEYIKMYGRTYNLSYIIFRYSNVYGPRQNATGEAGVVTIFINNILNNKECNIFGSGEQTRDFVYVKDIAEANLLGLERGQGVYVLGSGSEISVNLLFNKLKIIFNEMGRSVKKPVYRERIKGEVQRFVVNSDKARKEIGWSSKTNFDDGLKETVKWYMQRG